MRALAPGAWRECSLGFRRAPCIAVQRGAKFGGALPQPFVCLVDGTRPMWIELRASIGDHCQRFGNCLDFAIPARRMDHCFVQLPAKFPVRHQSGRRLLTILAESRSLRRKSVRHPVNAGSGRRPRRRGVKSSPRREPDLPGDLLRALFIIWSTICANRPQIGSYRAFQATRGKVGAHLGLNLRSQTGALRQLVGFRQTMLVLQAR
jgi:hypothetical protein